MCAALRQRRCLTSTSFPHYSIFTFLSSPARLLCFSNIFPSGSHVARCPFVILPMPPHFAEAPSHSGKQPSVFSAAFVWEWRRVGFPSTQPTQKRLPASFLFGKRVLCQEKLNVWAAQRLVWVTLRPANACAVQHL